MKVVILAGGEGNRLGGDTKVGPKPMIDIGGRPLLWHIMSRYGAFGFNEFVIAAGYQNEQIKRYFADFNLSHNDVRIDLSTGLVTFDEASPELNWIVDIVDTGRWTATAGRIRRVKGHLGEEPFMATFGDAVADVDLPALLEAHRSHARIATVTVVHPPPRFGELRLVDDAVQEFSEKPMDAGWINGGFMVFEPDVFDFIGEDALPVVPDLLAALTEKRELAAYRHDGFWQSVDSMRDKVLLEELWTTGSPPWTSGAVR